MPKKKGNFSSEFCYMISPMDDDNEMSLTADGATTATNTIHIDSPNGNDGTLSKVPILVEVPKQLQSSFHESCATEFRYRSTSELAPSRFPEINLEDFVDVVTTYKCKFCNFSCAWKNGLLSHLRTTHVEGLRRRLKREDEEEQMRPEPAVTQQTMVIGNVATGVSPLQEQQIFLCGQCNRGFVSLESCKDHMIEDHKPIKKPKPRKKRQERNVGTKLQRAEKEQTVDCIETLSKRKVRPPKSLSEDYYLSKARNYRRRHEMKEKLHKCDVKGCTQQLDTEEMLSYHKKCHIVDPSERCPFRCPECSSGTESWRQMKMHLWKEHQLDVALYPCPDCSYRTFSPSKLAEHRLIHRNERSFACTKCDKAFKQINQLRNHQVVHMDRKNLSVPRWYSEKKCNECNRSFSDTKSLRKHMQAVHSKLRPYVCSFCGHTSARKAMLQLHVRQHTGEKPFRCDICDYTTGDHNSLRRHKMRHTGLKPYKCPHCTYGCIQAISFKTHIKNKHPGMEGLFCCDLCTFRSVSKENYENHLADHDCGVVSPKVTPEPPVTSRVSCQTTITSVVKEQQQQPHRENIGAMEILPENLAAAQLIYSCLEAFSKKGEQSCSIETGDSQTITIRIPNDEQQDAEHIYLTIQQQPEFANDSTAINASVASNDQTGFELTARNEETFRSKKLGSDISLVTTNVDPTLVFCANTANMPLLTTEETSKLS